MKIRILFVCHGNICRSPMAEFVMKKMVKELPADSPLRGVDFEIASAATSTEEIGNPVYPPACRMLARHGIDCGGKTARQVTARDCTYYDYIVLMDRNNLRNIQRFLPRDSGQVSLLMEWLGESRDVADPWYTGDFQATWDDVNAGCRAMLSKLSVMCGEQGKNAL